MGDVCCWWEGLIAAEYAAMSEEEVLSTAIALDALGGLSTLFPECQDQIYEAIAAMDTSGKVSIPSHTKRRTETEQTHFASPMHSKLKPWVEIQ